MSFSRTAGSTFIPLLSRIVLGAAFFLTGWDNCFSSSTYTPEQIKQIESWQAEGESSTTIEPVSLQENGVEQEASAETDPNKRRSVYRIALLFQTWITEGVVPLAWGIAVFQLVAGALVLLGLFTRLWAILMAGLTVAIFILFVQSYGIFDMNPLQWRSNPLVYFPTFYLFMSFVLALGLFLTGPGILALDNMVFGRRHDPPGSKPAASPAA